MIDFQHRVEAQLQALSAGNAGATARVLVATGEGAVHRMLSALFATDRRLSLGAVSTREGALIAAGESGVKLALVDERLDRGNGLQLIKELKYGHRFVEIVAVVDTARSAIAVLDAGASDYLMRPFESVFVTRDKVMAALKRQFWREGIEQAIAHLADQTQGWLATLPEKERILFALQFDLALKERSRPMDAARIRCAVYGDPTLAMALKNFGYQVAAGSTVEVIAEFARAGLDVLVFAVPAVSNAPDPAFDRLREAAPVASLVVVDAPFQGGRSTFEPMDAVVRKVVAAVEEREHMFRSRATARGLLELLSRRPRDGRTY